MSQEEDKSSLISVVLKQHLGNDLTVVDAARVSLQKEAPELRPQDIKLIQFLADNGHMSPFRHCMVQFRIKAPEFVARQAFKHNVGISATSGPVHNCADAWNEVSMRYVRMNDFYVPEEWRKAPKEIRQGSSTDEHFTPEEQDKIDQMYRTALQQCQTTYKQMLEAGVAREMARMILPLSVQTEWIWTMSLQAAAHFVKLRQDPGAQLEIQQLAEQIEKLAEPVAPVSWKALMRSKYV
jgi:thymidylate synthase (FAD)